MLWKPGGPQDELNEMKASGSALARPLVSITRARLKPGIS